MSESIENAVQIAVYNALSNSAALVALLADNVEAAGFPAIYGYVPQSSDSGVDAAFPYVTIGEDNPVDFSTDTSSGAEVRLTIHTWSRQTGNREAKQIQGALYDALHRQELTVPDHEFIGCDFDNSTITPDPDQKTKHGVSEFVMWIDEAGYGL